MIGRKLKFLRETSGLTQAELAAALGISRSALSLYEIDKRDPDFATLKIICDYFGVSADYFVLDHAAPISPPNLSDLEIEVVNALRTPLGKKPPVDSNLALAAQAIGSLSEEKLLRLLGYVKALQEIPDGDDDTIVLKKRA